MKKEQWLNQKVMVDEWGRPPSLADVPLTFMTRAETFKKRNMDKEEIDRIAATIILQSWLENELL